MILITPQKAVEKGIFPSLEEAKKAQRDRRRCLCGRPAWRLAQTGLCFTCTTGEWDSSDDYELMEAQQ
jgi:hypothetical protein